MSRDPESIGVRDTFAVAALPLCGGDLTQWDLNRLFGNDRGGIMRSDIIAAQAYDIADAMLARRNYRE